MFRCSSAWNKIKEKRPKSQFKFLIWHNQIPFKASFLLWRSLNGKLPTNEKLNNFGTVPANCFCCSNRSRTDTINHIFNNGYLTVEVWRSFANMVGVKSDQSSLQQLIAQWYIMKHKNEAHKLILQATPILICRTYGNIGVLVNMLAKYPMV